MDWTTFEKKKLPKCRDVNRLIRGNDGQCYEVTVDPIWGKALTRVQDPSGMELSKEDIGGIKLAQIPKVPSKLWLTWINLCFDMCGEFNEPEDEEDEKRYYRCMNDYEVQIILLRQRLGIGRLGDWKFVVPKQEVTSGRVTADLTKSCDLITGEFYDGAWPDNGVDEGWAHCGSSHSHNTMEANFSYDDDVHELRIPGLHVVVGKIDLKKMTYVPNASIAVRGERKYINYRDLIDVQSKKEETYNYHPACKKMITKKKFKPANYNYNYYYHGYDKKGEKW